MKMPYAELPSLPLWPEILYLHNTMRIHRNSINIWAGLVLASCSMNSTQSVDNHKPVEQNSSEMTSDGKQTLETITLGAGCFWCVEAIFLDLKGVTKVVSGYAGGDIKNPSYKEICTGRTGHAEVCQVTWDPAVIDLQKILEVFWQTHDPTTLNRQGADVGTQYRSAIFYHNVNQQSVAQEFKTKLDASGAFKNPIVTEITAFTSFYAAEDYHQDYYSVHGEQPYCRAVIKPKLDKFRKAFAEDSKSQ